MSTNNLTPGTRVESTYSRVEDLSRLFVDDSSREAELVTAVKAYALAYAIYALCRVEHSLTLAGLGSAAVAMRSHGAHLGWGSTPPTQAA